MTPMLAAPSLAAPSLATPRLAARDSSSDTATSSPSTAPTSTCRPGEVLAVIGDNGAGKTTLIKALTGACSPDEGEILLVRQARPLPRPAGRAQRHGIETVYQDLAVGACARHRHEHVPRPRGSPPWTARHRCCRMLDKPRMRDEAAQHMADLKIGLRSLTQPVETLSGGQRQGVAVARAGGLGPPRGHHGRADRRPRGQGVRSGARLITRVRDRACPSC